MAEAKAKKAEEDLTEAKTKKKNMVKKVKEESKKEVTKAKKSTSSKKKVEDKNESEKTKKKQTLSSATKSVKKKFNSYHDLFEQKEYMKLMMATAISRLGDGIDTIAFSWLVYETTQSTFLVALLFAINGLPNILFGFLSGVLCSYYPKKWIATYCDLGRGLCVGIIGILYILGAIQVWHLFVITFINSTLESLRAPASTTIFSLLLTDETVDRGVALNTSTSRITEVIGLTIAPVCIAIFGVGGTIIIDAISFFVCSIIMLELRFKETIKKVKSEESGFNKYKQDFIDGIKYVLNDKLLFNICMFGMIANAVLVPITSLKAPYADDVLGRGAEALTFISMPTTVALAFGALIIPVLKEKLGSKKLLTLGGILIGIAYIGYAKMTAVPEDLTLVILGFTSFIMGVGLVAINVPVNVGLYKNVEISYMPRVSAIFNGLLLCTIPLTSWLIGLISQYLKLENLFMLFGIITLIIFICQRFNKTMIQLDKY